MDIYGDWMQMLSHIIIGTLNWPKRVWEKHLIELLFGRGRIIVSNEWVFPFFVWLTGDWETSTSQGVVSRLDIEMILLKLCKNKNQNQYTNITIIKYFNFYPSQSLIFCIPSAKYTCGISLMTALIRYRPSIWYESILCFPRNCQIPTHMPRALLILSGRERDRQSNKMVR